jgi:septal ring-binding cell division protein DamX
MLALSISCGSLMTLPGCGDSGPTQADVDRARSEGAQQARQSQRIKQLEQEVREGQKIPTETVAVTVTEGTPPTAERTWPAGTSGYTVVLASEGSEASANAVAADARRQDLDAGVLRSDDYSSLRPGYWVAFAGRYPTSAEAKAAAGVAQGSGFSGAYARLVAP